MTDSQQRDKLSARAISGGAFEKRILQYGEMIARVSVMGLTGVSTWW
jgi:hypothetical protein